MKVECKVWGHPWLGIFRLKIVLANGDYKTFWHLKIWEFSFGVSFPASVVNAIVKAR